MRDAQGVAQERRFLVVGGGSIGRRHLRNLKQLGAGSLAVFDPAPERRLQAARESGADAVDALDPALRRADVAIVCSPTHLHAAHALAAAKAGCSLFVEKPVATDPSSLDDLEREVEERNLTAFVACNFRFHPGLLKTKQLLEEGAVGRTLTARAQFGQYLPDWHPWEDYRASYSANRAMGGGVALDRIHEIDYLCWLFGDVREMFAVAERLSDLEIDCEDVVEAILRFESGVLVSLHLDYVRRSRDCSLEINGAEGVIQWQFETNSLSWRIAGQDVRQRLEWECDVNSMYIAEMRHFLEALAGRIPPAQTLAQARRSLEIALAIKRSAQTRAMVTL